MTPAWVVLALGVVALVAAAWLVGVPALRRRRLEATSARRILFPFLGTSLSRPTLDAALRLARSERATLVPAYLAIVRRDLSLEAAISREAESAMPLLETIEQHATRLDVEVDSRIERGRSPRHALAQLLENERFDTLVIPAATDHSDGFAPSEVAWVLETAPGAVLVVRPQDSREERE